MSKYDRLGDHLRQQAGPEVPMSFAEIERVTGVPLPAKSQSYAAWWSNNPSNNVMTKVWLAAGFKTERVDLRGRRLVFRRAKALPVTGSDGIPRGSQTGRASRHPALGGLKGLIQVVPGTDLTKPVDPTWGE